MKKDAVKVGTKLATGNFGYGQDDRTSAWARNGKLGIAGLQEPGDTDCSFGTALALYLGGLIPESILNGVIYSGNFPAKMASTGMYDTIDVRGMSLSEIEKRAGDASAITGPGHVMLHLGNGRWMSFETTERGTSTGGRRGDQTGREGYIRSLYMRGASSRRKGRSRTGWTYLSVLRSEYQFMARAIAAYGNTGTFSTFTDRMTRVAEWDGKRFDWFMNVWKRWDKGVKITFSSQTLRVPEKNHAYVILGSTIPKMERRLKTVLPALLGNTASKVVVTGGVKRGSLTEAEWMKQWLVQNGVGSARILVENKASSTVGNALHSVRLMADAGITSYTLVSDASHLRRASVHFLAARVKQEMVVNKRLKLITAGLIGFNDYGDVKIKPLFPISDSGRKAVAAEVAALFGVSSEYRKVS